MERNAWQKGLFAGLVLCLIAAPALAQTPATGEGAAHTGWQTQGDFRRDGERHELMQGQHAGMKAFRESSRARLKALREKMKSTRQELRSVLDADQLDTGRAQQLAGELKQIFAQMVDARLDIALKMRSMMTPEQFQYMKEMRAKRGKGGPDGWRRGDEQGPEGRGQEGWRARMKERRAHWQGNGQDTAEFRKPAPGLSEDKHQGGDDVDF